MRACVCPCVARDLTALLFTVIWRSAVMMMMMMIVTIIVRIIMIVMVNNNNISAFKFAFNFQCTARCVLLL